VHFWDLKKRFMILKHPIRLRRLESIEPLLLACAVLHKKLIDYDGRDDWEEREEMKDIEDVESYVEGDVANQWAGLSGPALLRIL
jgi:hypothetical protein